MATLITMTKSGGGPTRSCDGRCHEAKGSKCTCICGGVNHGIGHKKAVENVRKVYEDLLDTDPTARIHCDPEQLYLFNHKKEA